MIDHVPVIFIQRLGLVNVAKHRLLEIKHGTAHQPLPENEDVCNQSHFPMHALETSLGVRSFVHLDDDQASDEQDHRDGIGCRVNIRASELVFLGRGRLKDERALDEKEDCQRVEQRMVGKEHDLVLEHCSPYKRSEDEDASLGEDCCDMSA